MFYNLSFSLLKRAIRNTKIILFQQYNTNKIESYQQTIQNRAKKELPNKLCGQPLRCKSATGYVYVLLLYIEIEHMSLTR